jgi:hypothetical protein
MLAILWFSCSQRLFGYFALQSFDIDRTWWRLFQKPVVGTKLDVYVLIAITEVDISTGRLLVPESYHPPSIQYFGAEIEIN